jgi:hypothetical protein
VAPAAGVRLDGWLPDLTGIPEMDKASSIKAYGVEQRCLDGVLPRRGVVADESSGSSGSPTNWVRGRDERNAVRQILQATFTRAVGDKPIFVLNAFSLGAWATGMNVSNSLADVCIIKSTGPDLTKIIDTMKAFGPAYGYVIMGYPPFLKNLVRRPPHRPARLRSHRRLRRRGAEREHAPLPVAFLPRGDRLLRRLGSRDQHGSRDRVHHRAAPGAHPQPRAVRRADRRAPRRHADGLSVQPVCLRDPRRRSSHLCRVNRDFEHAYGDAKPSTRPRLHLYAYGTGPFKDASTKLKHEYVWQLDAAAAVGCGILGEPSVGQVSPGTARSHQ